jgi:predicted tellurium resistance membrane protein TerC
MDALLTPDAIIALITLTAMEIVLGIDNIIFIAILVGKLPRDVQAKARKIGISLALITRLALLFSIVWVMSLTRPLLTIFQRDISGRDLILLLGGLFLIAKSTFEIHDKLESGPEESNPSVKGSSRFVSTIIQITILDIVFSLDSVITAVGMAQQISIMVIAMVIAVIVMLFSSGAISDFVHRHPTIKILALSFLLLIGVMLVAEGMGTHVGKGYIYFAMAFSLGVEILNMNYRKRHMPVHLNEPHAPDQKD